jgi:hypothetical protein
MVPFVTVTPIDEMEGEKHVVHSPMLVNPMALRKIEAIEIVPPKPVVPLVAAADKEPIAPSPAVAPVAVAPMLVTMITFLDGKTMHVKEAMASFAALTA